MNRRVIRPSADVELNIDEDEGIVIAGPVTGKKYRFTLVSIPSSAISRSASTSTYNGRSTQHHSLASVSDIYPEIKKDKKNSNPIKAYGTKANFKIFEGTRRAYAVSLLEDGHLDILLTPTMDEDDAKAFSQRSDKYSKPTTVDLAFKIKELALEGLSIRALAQELDCSKSTAENAKKILTLEESIFKLFPALRFIDVRFLLNLVKIRNENVDKFTSAISNVEGFKAFLTEEQLKKYDNNEVIDEALFSKVTATVQAHILKALTEKQPTSLPEQFEVLNEIKGLKVKVNNKGQLTLTLDKALADLKGAEIASLLGS